MRTQRAYGPAPARGLLTRAGLALLAFLLPVAGASAQGDGGAAGGQGGPSSALLLGGAGVLLLVAAGVGYGLPAVHRRRAGGMAEPPRAAEGGFAALTQTEHGAPETGDGPPSWAGQERREAPQPSWRVPDRWPAASRPSERPHSGRGRALGYTTFRDRRRAVSPESRYEARRIAAACEVRGMVLHKLVGDVQSYSGPDLERPGLNHALALLAADQATCLVVTGLDRLSRSAATLGTVIEWLEGMGARLVVVDMDLDTDSEEGRLAARALVRVGALERRSGRGGEQPPVRALQGTRRRPAVADLPLLQRRIATMRASGLTLQAIADTLNSEGVPTLRGGAEWRPSSVQAATGYKRPGRHPSEPLRDQDEDD